MGMLTEDFCRDLMQFSASQSLVKIHIKLLLRNGNMKNIFVLRVRE